MINRVVRQSRYVLELPPMKGNKNNKQKCFRSPHVNILDMPNRWNSVINPAQYYSFLHQRMCYFIFERLPYCASFCDSLGIGLLVYKGGG